MCYDINTIFLEAKKSWGAKMKYNLLNKKINESKVEISDISDKTGIPLMLLKAKLSGKCSWNLDEANALGDFINLSKAEKADIFFGSEADNE